jgi:uncharacterized protein involved in response to NO
MTVHSTRANPDRSAPRRRVREGDSSIDRRGRISSAPPLLSYGFRPFFLSAALYATIAVPAWLLIWFSGTIPAGPFQGPAWHAHEMIFGYLAAVMAGFVLTAVPNWTGRLPISGASLAFLVGSWALGRIACSAIAAPIAAALLDLLFPLLLMASVWREVIAGRNWRNAPVGLLLTLFMVSNLLHHLEISWKPMGGVSVRLALGVAAVLIALIGGRIVPSFTRNWLVKQASSTLPASFGRLDRIALIVTVAGIGMWVALPFWSATGVALTASGSLVALRLSRWRGLRTWSEPIVLILHVGYLWLAASLALLGLSILTPDLVRSSAGIHALTAGAIGTMTLAVMTRASRGHTGRSIEADRLTLAVYAAVTVAALLRVAAPFLPSSDVVLLVLAAAFWSLAFGLFLIGYGGMLIGPRAHSH